MKKKEQKQKKELTENEIMSDLPNFKSVRDRAEKTREMAKKLGLLKNEDN